MNAGGRFVFFYGIKSDMQNFIGTKGQEQINDAQQPEQKSSCGERKTLNTPTKAK